MIELPNHFQKLVRGWESLPFYSRDMVRGQERDMERCSINSSSSFPVYPRACACEGAVSLIHKMLLYLTVSGGSVNLHMKSCEGPKRER